jgi:predicted enzyme related to lactoylglutathione lyase
VTQQYWKCWSFGDLLVEIISDHIQCNHIILDKTFCKGETMDSTMMTTFKSMSPQLLVMDIERSLEYYILKLGFNLDFRYEDFYAGVSRDGHSIHLKQGSPAKQERENRMNNGHVDVTFIVEGLDALLKAVQNQSIEIAQQSRDMPYGREFYIFDPDGYILAFLETKQ